MVYNLVAYNKILKEEFRQCEWLPKSRLEHPYNNWKVPQLPPKAALALCEDETEVDYFIKAANLKIDALIALTPQAAAQCYLKGKQYLKIEDFFDVTAFMQYDEPMLEFQSHWAEKVDAFLWAIWPHWCKVEFRPAGTYFFFLKVLIDMIFKTTFSLAHLFIACHPSKVFFFDESETDKIDKSLFLNRSIYRQVLPLCAVVYDVPITWLSPLPRSEKDQKRPRSIFQTLLTILPPKLVDKMRRIKAYGLSSIISSGNSLDNAPNLLINPSFEVNIVAQCAKKLGFQLSFFDNITKTYDSEKKSSSDLLQILTEAWGEIDKRPFFREPFVWCGVDLGKVAASRLSYWWHTIIPIMWQMYQQTLKCFEVNRPQIVLTTSPVSPEDISLLQAARHLKIPAVIHTHGCDGIWEYSTYDMTDLRQGDYLFVYGQGVADYLRNRNAHSTGSRAEICAVGSARIDALRLMIERENESSKIRKQLKVEDKDTLILYLPTSYQYNWYMARQSYIGTPYFELLIEAMNVLAKFPATQFVYKAFPEYPIDPISRVLSRYYPNIKFIMDIPVSKLLQACDAFIIDFPSTGLGEAMITNKPILVFSDSRFIALRPEARALLSKRVTLSETSEEFLKNLYLFLSQGNFDRLKHPDREFLRAYCTHQDDGKSACRAALYLHKIVHDKK